MKIHICIILILGLLLSSTIKAQNLDVKIYDAITHKEIDSVKIYSKKSLLTEYKKNLKNTVKVIDLDSIFFVKEGYEDVIISRGELLKKPTVYLKKNKFIDIEEVKLSKISPSTTLKKIINAEKTYASSCGKLFYYLNYELTKNTKEVMQAYDGRLIMNKEIDVRIEKPLLINKLYGTKNKIDDKKWVELQQTNYAQIGSFQVYPQLYKIFIRENGIENYNLKIDGSKDNYIRLSFSPKIDNGNKNTGYIIFDKDDFRVYEIKSRLLNNKNNINDNLLFTDSELFLKREKIAKKCYKLVRANSKDNFTIVKGVGKGFVFSSKTSLEETPAFEYETLSPFDVTFFEFK